MQQTVAIEAAPPAAEKRRGSVGAPLGQADAALGGVRGVVADAFQVAGDLQRGDDLAQVVGDRLAQREQADDETLDLALQLVDLGIEFHRAHRGGGVALHHRLGREADLALDDPAHLGEHGAETRQLLARTLLVVMRSCKISGSERFTTCLSLIYRPDTPEPSSGWSRPRHSRADRRRAPAARRPAAIQPARLASAASRSGRPLRATCRGRAWASGWRRLGSRRGPDG